MEYDTDWQEKYQDLIETPSSAISRLKSGQRVFIGTGCGEPVELVEEMTKHANRLADVRLIQLFTKGDAPYATDQLADSFIVNSFFIGSNIRGIVQRGLGDYTPILLSDIPQLFHSGRLPVDVALIQVTPPNLRGKVSLGISVDVVRSAAENASLVIALVNPNMPWTCGDSQLDVNDLDILVPSKADIIQRDITLLDHLVGDRIGKYVAALIPDGATLEFGLGRVPGVGRLPHAVMEHLHDKKELGIHTEMLTEAVIDLVESGVVTGSRKTTDRGRITCSFCMGSKRLYEFIDNNSTVYFRPTEHVNNPSVIGSQNKMVAINIALEIDLTGQVCSDSVGNKFYSGIGGHVVFHRGASQSKGGRAIIVIPSLNQAGERSRIVSTLQPGSGVTITRGNVHYVVTEYGVAYLHGKSIQERVVALISIAHPDFREQLMKEAVAAHLIPPDMGRVSDRMGIVGGEFMRSSLLLDDGTLVSFRSIWPTDEPNIRDLIYDLSKETIYYRFMGNQARFSHEQLQDFVFIDHRRDVAVVGTIPEVDGDHIIAVGRYYLNENTNKAEVAFVIRDGWQNKRIGSFLFNHLASIAKQNGIAGFTAAVLPKNRRMRTIFNNSGHKVRSTNDNGVYSITIDF